jgi:hypothetical protein
VQVVLVLHGSMISTSCYQLQHPHYSRVFTVPSAKRSTALCLFALLLVLAVLGIAAALESLVGCIDAAEQRSASSCCDGVLLVSSLSALVQVSSTCFRLLHDLVLIIELLELASCLCGSALELAYHIVLLVKL